MADEVLTFDPPVGQRERLSSDAQACDPRIWEAEKGILISVPGQTGLQVQPGLHSKTPSLKGTGVCFGGTEEVTLQLRSCTDLTKNLSSVPRTHVS